MKKIGLFCLFALALLLAGCDSTPEKPAQTSNDMETGRLALQRMVVPARGWASDAQPIRMKSNAGKDNTGHDGKSSYWQTTFASAGRQKIVTFSWSGAPPRGVDHGTEDTYNAGNRSTQPFDLSFLKVDSDKAFEVAQEHGGKQSLEKNPQQQVFYLLDWDSRINQLRWHVMYGTSENNAQLTVIVDASTGGFIHKE